MILTRFVGVLYLVQIVICLLVTFNRRYIVNEHQKYNHEITEQYDNIREIYTQDPYRFSKVFKCNTCGAFLSSPIIEFFNFDVDRYLCYDCQKNNK